jgi:hypothetical protein
MRLAKARSDRVISCTVHRASQAQGYCRWSSMRDVLMGCANASMHWARCTQVQRTRSEEGVRRRRAYRETSQLMGRGGAHRRMPGAGRWAVGGQPTDASEGERNAGNSADLTAPT